MIEHQRKPLICHWSSGRSHTWIISSHNPSRTQSNHCSRADLVWNHSPKVTDARGSFSQSALAQLTFTIEPVSESYPRGRHLSKTPAMCIYRFTVVSVVQRIMVEQREQLVPEGEHATHVDQPLVKKRQQEPLPLFTWLITSMKSIIPTRLHDSRTPNKWILATIKVVNWSNKAFLCAHKYICCLNLVLNHPTW